MARLISNNVQGVCRTKSFAFSIENQIPRNHRVSCHPFILFTKPRDDRRAKPLAAQSRKGQRNGAAEHSLGLLSDESSLDKDIQQVLEIATDGELKEIFNVLHSKSLFSPIVKSAVTGHAEGGLPHDREDQIRVIERRFRFLAANAGDTLRGRLPTYRETLLEIRKQLHVDCSLTLSTIDLETEIFLHLLEKHPDCVEAITEESANSAAAIANIGDGMAPTEYKKLKGFGRFIKALSPLKLGSKEVLPTAAKVLTTVAATKIGTSLVQQFALQFMRNRVQYEAAVRVATATGGTSFRQASAIMIAQRGIATAATKYAMTRGLLVALGPALWAATAIDCARMAVGSDYARISQAIFLFSQIRLIKLGGWTANE